MVPVTLVIWNKDREQKTVSKKLDDTPSASPALFSLSTEQMHLH